MNEASSIGFELTDEDLEKVITDAVETYLIGRRHQRDIRFPATIFPTRKIAIAPRVRSLLKEKTTRVAIVTRCNIFMQWHS